VSDEDNWSKVVLIATAIIITIFIAKIVFWVAIVCIAIGIILIRESYDTAIPILMITVGMIVALISFYIGYIFPTTQLGNYIVTSANVILDADRQLNEALNNVTNTVNEVLINVTRNISSK
jgi:hypothetical protein